MNQRPQLTSPRSDSHLLPRGPVVAGAADYEQAPWRAYGRAVLHSYSLVFFSQHKGLAALLLLATFANPWAGAAGLAAVALAVAAARLGGFNRELTDLGAYSFNSLLVALALSALYAPSPAWAGAVAVGAGLALLLSVALTGWLGGRGLPALSLPLVLALWLLAPALARVPGLSWHESGFSGLSAWQALGGAPLAAAAHALANVPWPPALLTFLRALSGALFQDNAAAGSLVAAGLLWHSRIAFSLAGLAFAAACGLSLWVGPLLGGFDTYNLGANCLLAAIVVGGVFVVPSPASYGWALLSVPLTAVLLAGLAPLLALAGLPLYSLPFVGTSLLFLYVLLLRERPGGWLVLVPVQRYSPEANLYAYTTDCERLAYQLHFPLTLPFLGAWRCTQGYDVAGGGPTHQGPWGQALDFDIADRDGRTYRGPGLALSDYYCFDKPVLAPADGVVEEIVNHLEDNPIGEVNLRENWGNTVVLRHRPGLYTQLSHLRAGSVRVRPGEAVRRGQVLASCGNSGRSPEPHLHFQVQATPYVGSRTLAYPLAYFQAESSAGGAPELRRAAVPAAGDTVWAPLPQRLLSQALRLPPGYALAVRAEGTDGPAQRWEVFTDAYNHTYLRCHDTGAVAYFERDDATFCFTAYYGPESAWLYLFYRAAYRLNLAGPPAQEVHDAFPLTVVRNPVLKWAQDAVAPFFRFVHPTFALRGTAADARSLRLASEAAVGFGRRRRVLQTAELLFQDGALAELTVRQGGRTLRLRCEAP